MDGSKYDPPGNTVTAKMESTWGNWWCPVWLGDEFVWYDYIIVNHGKSSVP